jgi:hypothetical protein
MTRSHIEAPSDVAFGSQVIELPAQNSYVEDESSIRKSQEAGNTGWGKKTGAELQKYKICLAFNARACAINCAKSITRKLQISYNFRGQRIAKLLHPVRIWAKHALRPTIHIAIETGAFCRTACIAKLQSCLTSPGFVLLLDKFV